ncbi:MAG: hypothetical protein NTU41_11635 [Chloroflexi bacterium]|nr:hypothetical protein [Chloroflexota bacterium]
MDDQKNIPYKTYIGERASLVNAELEQSRQFDKYVLAMAGGAFGLSLAFIRDVVPAFKAGTVLFLVASWSTFGVSILSTLISLLASQSALRRQREILDSQLGGEEQTEARPDRNRMAVLTNTLNWFAALFLVAGVGLLTAFTALNLL